MLLLCPPPFCALICYSFSFHTPSYQFLSVICCSLRFARIPKKKKIQQKILHIRNTNVQTRPGNNKIFMILYYNIYIYCTIYKTYSNNYLLARRVQKKKKITLVLKNFDFYARILRALQLFTNYNIEFHIYFFKVISSIGVTFFRCWSSSALPCFWALFSVIRSVTNHTTN